MTLDAFIRFNAATLEERGWRLANATGHANLETLADAVLEFIRRMGLTVHLGEVRVTAYDLETLIAFSFHPLMGNNPRPVSPAELHGLYASIL